MSNYPNLDYDMALPTKKPPGTLVHVRVVLLTLEGGPVAIDVVSTRLLSVAKNASRHGRTDVRVDVLA